MSSFEMQISQFRDKTVAKIDNIYRDAIRNTIAQAMEPQPSVKETGGTFVQGKIPVDTGKLFRSLYVTINGRKYNRQSNSFRRTIDRVKATDRVSFGWNAKHAAKMEFGDGQVQGRFFATKASNRWRTNVNRAKAKFSG